MYPKRGASSVQGLKRDVRKALTHDSYTDIDMVNAHPCILSQLFKRHNLGPRVFSMDSALLLFVTDKYSVRPNVYATPGRAAAAAALAMVE